MNKKIKHLAIIINYKDRDETTECINSILGDGSNDKFDILVIDNEQVNAKSEELYYRELHHSIRYIANYENKGFSAAVNQGAIWARDKAYENIILINNDTRIKTGAINYLIQACEAETNEDVVGYIPIICYYDQRDKIWNAGGKIYSLGYKKCVNSDKNLNQISSFQDLYTYATGCFILFKLKSFQDMGMYSEDFFFGEEDFNFSYKLREKRGQYRLVKNSIVYHKVSQTILKNKEKIPNTIYLYYLNRFIDLKKLIGPFYLIALLSIYLPYIYLIILKNKMKFKVRFEFIFGIVRDSFNLDGVTMDFFREIMKRKY